MAVTDRRSLEERLIDAAAHVSWPESDMTDAVRRRIESPALSPPRRGWPRPAVAAVAALAVVVLIMAVPATRRAIADLLGVGGIDIVIQGDVDRTGGGLRLGAPVSLSAAVDAMDHPVLVPDRSALGKPSAAFVSDVPTDSVWMAWEPTDSLPQVAGTDVGLLFLQFRAEVGEGAFRKELGAGTTVEEVTVGDSGGFWIEGAPHGIDYVTADGETMGELSRLAANVLIWEQDRITYRLESELSREESLDIAESLVPASQ